MIFRFDQCDAKSYEAIMAACHMLCSRAVSGAQTEWYDYMSHIGMGPIDGESSVHLAIGEQDQIWAYCRLMPTTAPHPAAEAFPIHLGVVDYPKGPDIYELSPILFDPHMVETEHKGDLFDKMLKEILRTCYEKQIVRLVFAAEAMWLTWYLKSGLEVYPLGLPNRVIGRTVVPLALHVPKQSQQ